MYFLGKVVGFMKGVAATVLCEMAITGVFMINSEIDKRQSKSDQLKEAANLGFEKAGELFN